MSQYKTVIDKLRDALDAYDEARAIERAASEEGMRLGEKLSCMGSLTGPRTELLDLLATHRDTMADALACYIQSMRDLEVAADAVRLLMVGAVVARSQSTIAEFEESLSSFPSAWDRGE